MVRFGSNNSYQPKTNTAWVRTRFCKLQKRCTRLAAASDKVYQLLAHGRWFSPILPITSCNFHLFVTNICLASSNERMMNAIVFSSHRFAVFLGKTSWSLSRRFPWIGWKGNATGEWNKWKRTAIVCMTKNYIIFSPIYEFYDKHMYPLTFC
jgi:hypothetical protein